MALTNLSMRCPTVGANTKFPIFLCGNFADNRNKELKLPEGAALLGEERQEPQDLNLEENFSTHTYLKQISTSLFGKCLLYSPCLPSTHTLLSQNFEAFPIGTVCVADSQVSGKGRTNNVWVSPKGCLMFSFTVEMSNGHMLPFLQYVVSIALVDAIEQISLHKGLPSLPVKIKWPNDLYANGLKIGGVLCTSTYREKKFNIVVGVGLNVGNHKPTTCLDALLQGLVPNAPPYQREELLAAFFVKFENIFDEFLDQGFAPLESSYYEKWLHSGQLVVLEEKKDDNSIEKVPLVIQGLSPTGYLLAKNDQLESYELHPDGNSFDFLSGLVRTKVQL